jgi:hypothetical protein
VRIWRRLLKFPHKQKNFVCFLSKVRAANVSRERVLVSHSGVSKDTCTVECYAMSTWYIISQGFENCNAFIFRVKQSNFGNFGNYLPDICVNYRSIPHVMIMKIFLGNSMLNICNVNMHIYIYTHTHTHIYICMYSRAPISADSVSAVHRGPLPPPPK